MDLETLTFGQLAPVIRYGATHSGVDLSDTDATTAYATKVLQTLGYFKADAESNARTIALMVYSPVST